jgi:hypothetical protein
MQSVAAFGTLEAIGSRLGVGRLVRGGPRTTRHKIYVSAIFPASGVRETRVALIF